MAPPPRQSADEAMQQQEESLLNQHFLIRPSAGSVSSVTVTGYSDPAPAAEPEERVSLAQAASDRLARAMRATLDTDAAVLADAAGAGTVATEAAVGELFRQLDAVASQSTADPAAVALLRGAEERLRPLANSLSAAMVDEILERLAGGGPSSSEGLAMAVMLAYVDAATRVGKYAPAGGTAISTMIRYQDAQQQHLAELAIALAEYQQATGLVEMRAFATMQQLGEQVSRLSELGVQLSALADRLGPACLPPIVGALDDFTRTGTADTLAGVVAGITAASE